MHDAAIEACEAVLPFRAVVVGDAKDTDSGPRSHDQGDNQRKDHCRGRTDGDGPHIGS